MRETLDQHLTQQYEVELTAELAIQGLSATQQTDCLAEAMDHLNEAVAAANPETAEDVKRVITQFGSAKLLARRLASEQARLKSRRRFLWPALSILPLMYLSLHPLPQARLFHNAIYSGTLYLILAAVILFVLGFKARKPLFGQFAAVAGIMIVCQMIWYPAMNYPMVFGPKSNPSWVDVVPRRDYDKELASLDKAIANENRVVDEIRAGKTLFVGQAAPANLPSAFSYSGSYWLPEGLREVEIGIKPNEIYPGLRTASWAQAVIAWNTPNGHGYVEESDADRLLRQSPEQVAILQSGMDSLRYFRNQPLTVQIAAYFPTVALRALALCGMAALCTNAGWLLWLICRELGRVRRRMTLGIAT